MATTKEVRSYMEPYMMTLVILLLVSSLIICSVAAEPNAASSAAVADTIPHAETFQPDSIINRQQDTTNSNRPIKKVS